MNRHTKLVCLACLLPLAGRLWADQPQMIFTKGAANTWNSDWTGVAERTYFYQWSLDLVNWHYAPFMEFGTGIKSWGIDASDSGGAPLPKLFVRLRYTDQPVADLQAAKEADYDGDGVPNLFEVATAGSDPLDKNSLGADTDSDGLPDGWELFHFGDITSQSGAGNADQDGLTNKEEYDLILDPNVNESAEGSPVRTSYNYDDAGRLTGVTSPLSTRFYTPDEEGNILNAQ